MPSSGSSPLERTRYGIRGLSTGSITGRGLRVAERDGAVLRRALGAGRHPDRALRPNSLWESRTPTLVCLQGGEMVVYKKVIPSLAAAAMSLTGCGDSGSSGDALASSLRSFCMKLVECYPEDGYTLQECVAYYNEYINDYLGSGGPGCESALTSYFNCIGALTCEQLEDPEFCDAEFQTFFVECVPSAP